MSKVKIEGNASGTGTLTISAPNTNTDRTLTLPDGAGELLTDASGLSATNLTSGTIPDARFPSALPAIDGSALTGVGGGKVLQVVSSVDSTSASSSSTVTSQSISITPSSTFSKIFVVFSMALESAGGTADRGIHNRVYRTLNSNTTLLIYQPYEMYDSNSSSQRIGKRTYTYLDSPSTTSSVSYHFEATATSGTVRINNYGSSHFTLMEIAG